MTNYIGGTPFEASFETARDTFFGLNSDYDHYCKPFGGNMRVDMPAGEVDIEWLADTSVIDNLTSIVEHVAKAHPAKFKAREELKLLTIDEDTDIERRHLVLTCEPSDIVTVMRGISRLANYQTRIFEPFAAVQPVSRPTTTSKTIG